MNYEKMLNKLNEKITSEIKYLKKSEITETSADEMDRVNDQEKEKMRQNLLSSKTNFLNQIFLAMASVQNGTYGNCEECECLIALGRLKAKPTASRCIECQIDHETFERRQHDPQFCVN